MIPQTFSDVVFTNPSSKGIVPRRIGDTAGNSTTLEIWESVAVANEPSSWVRKSAGKYGGTLITDFNAPNISGVNTASSDADNAPNNLENWYCLHMNSNNGVASAVQFAIGFTTGKIYQRLKINSVWGDWIPALKNEQTRSQNANLAPSSKLFDDELNKNECYNVTNRMPLSAGQYYDLASAIAAVPVANRKLGLKLTYMSALYEKDTLTISAIPTTAGNITITLNGIASTIAVDPSIDTTTTLVANKIRDLVLADWELSGTGANIIFTKSEIGVCSAPVFNGGTTGVTASFVRTVVGTAESIIETQFNGSSVASWTTQANWRRVANNDDLVQLSSDLIESTNKIERYIGIVESPLINIAINTEASYLLPTYAKIGDIISVTLVDSENAIINNAAIYYKNSQGEFLQIGEITPNIKINYAVVADLFAISIWVSGSVITKNAQIMLKVEYNSSILPKIYNIESDIEILTTNLEDEENERSFEDSKFSDLLEMESSYNKRNIAISPYVEICESQSFVALQTQVGQSVTITLKDTELALTENAMLYASRVNGSNKLIGGLTPNNSLLYTENEYECNGFFLYISGSIIRKSSNLIFKTLSDRNPIENSKIAHNKVNEIISKKLTTNTSTSFLKELIARVQNPLSGNVGDVIPYNTITSISFYYGYKSGTSQWYNSLLIYYTIDGTTYGSNVFSEYFDSQAECEFSTKICGDAIFNSYALINTSGLSMSEIYTISYTTGITNEFNYDNHPIIDKFLIDNKLNIANTFAPFFKKAICIGDSITQGVIDDKPRALGVHSNESYPTILSKLTGWDITNAGVAGIKTDEWYQTEFNKYIYTDYDIAFINLGTNGGLGGDYLIAYKNIVNGLKSANPKILIFLIVPHMAHLNSSHYGTELAVKSVGQELSVPVINLKDTKIVNLNDPKYHGLNEFDVDSGIHFNCAGYVVLSQFINRKVYDYCNENVKTVNDLHIYR